MLLQKNLSSKRGKERILRADSLKMRSFFKTSNIQVFIKDLNSKEIIYKYKLRSLIKTYFSS